MAKKFLQETEMNVTEIGFQCGFSSNAYFGKIFREKCGGDALGIQSPQPNTS